jgi:hypothetical protein
MNEPGEPMRSSAGSFLICSQTYPQVYPQVYAQAQKNTSCSKMPHPDKMSDETVSIEVILTQACDDLLNSRGNSGFQGQERCLTSEYQL